MPQQHKKHPKFGFVSYYQVLIPASISYCSVFNYASNSQKQLLYHITDHKRCCNLPIPNTYQKCHCCCAWHLWFRQTELNSQGIPMVAATICFSFINKRFKGAKNRTKCFQFRFATAPKTHQSPLQPTRAAYFVVISAQCSGGRAAGRQPSLMASHEIYIWPKRNRKLKHEANGSLKHEV